MAAFRAASFPEPNPFSGEPEDCGGFLLQLDLAFNRSPESFMDAAARVSYFVAKLRARAL